jgi:3'-phosphoadenosine 5'-phosphosulfate sulfotransferase (PAPS reductase)/FAD synthetase
MLLTLPLLPDYMPIEVPDPPAPRVPHPSLPGPFAEDLESYNRYIVAFSGGKDSVASVLCALENGIPREQLELWHHCVDGNPYEPTSTLMDWPCTTAYCRAFAAALGIPLYLTWKVGGFEGEMLRENAKTNPICFEAPQPDGSIVIKQTGGLGGKESTRLAFPQVAASLSVRWCSAYLKIDNARTALRNQERFNHSRTLFISGERAEESANRSLYAHYEIDDADARLGNKERHIDRWRSVLYWTEAEVWAILERWRVNPHPAYHIGWGRCSCMNCIFNRANQWATLRKINFGQFSPLVAYENIFERTIHRSLTLDEQADRGQPFDATPALVEAALSPHYTQPIFLPAGTPWSLPAGAFGENAGPV